MREIKFRAWNNNKMTYDVTVGMVAGKTAQIYLHWGKTTPNYPECEGFSKTSILMQYTGLKDKNGKEIYEGDIMRSLYGYKNNRPLKVFFEHGCYFLRNDGIASATSFEDLFLQDFEVIGNIYENPELLPKGE